MKKLLHLTILLVSMPAFVLAQNPPGFAPNPFSYNDNNTNVPQIIRTSYYDKANNGSKLLYVWGPTENSEPYAAFTIAGANFSGALNVRILFPTNYNPNDGKKYPVVLFLHGKGEAGTNDLYNSFLPCDAPPCVNNNEMSMLWWGREQIRANRGGEFNQNYDTPRNAFWVVPQNGGGYWPDGNQENGFMRFIDPVTGQPYPTNGHSGVVMQLMEYLSTGNAVANDGTVFNTDPNRFYIHGLSAGGGGTFDFIYRRPDIFAGAIPYSAGGDRSDYVANRMRHIPIWVWQGGRDDNPCTSVSTEVYNKYISVSPIKRDNNAVFRTYNSNSQQPLPCAYLGASKDLYDGNKRYTLVPEQAHGSWFDAYDHPDLFRWLFDQSKLKINAFSDTVKCNGGSVRIGIDEGFAAYEWKLENTTLAFTTNEIDVDTPGKYYVRIKRRNPYTNVVGNWSEWSGSLEIVGTPGGSTGKPEVTANNSLILPSLAGNSVTLSAPAGYSGYLWSNGVTNAGSTQNITVTTAGSYTVRVTSGSCQSQPSDPLIVRTTPGANPPNGNPTGLTATGITATSIQLNWADGSSNETAFEIYRATTAGGPLYIYLGTVGANVTTFTNTGLTSNTFYYYRVRAVNVDGASAYTNEANSEPLPDTEPPTAPTNLAATGISGNALTLTWTASTDNVAVTGYEIFRDGVSVGTSATNSFYVTGLSPSTDYTFTVRARDFRNNFSPLSSPFTATTSDLVSGIVNYTYYESNSTYFTMPDFNSLTEKKRGVVGNFSITPRDREEFFQFKFESKLQVAIGGAYTFYTTSDDGSVLYIDGTLVVNNDGAHSSQERSGNITLTAGLHDIMVLYYNNAGTFGTILEVRWESSAAGIPKQIIPSSVLLGFPLPKIYFAKATGDLTDPATWGVNADGSGESPTNFTASQQTFTLGRTATLTTNWSVSGSQSKVIIANSGSLNTSGFAISGTAKVNLEGNGTLLLGNSNLPNFGTISQGSTINYTADANVTGTITYGNLILSGGGLKNFAAGNYNVDGNLTIATGLISAPAEALVNLKGNLNMNAALSMPFTLNATGNTQTFTGNGNDIEVQNFGINAGTTVILSNVGGSSSLRVLNSISIPTGATLDINTNTLTLAGNSALNSNTETGAIKTNGGRLVINSTGTNNSNLYFAASGNNLKDLVINETGAGEVNLKNTLNLTGTLSLNNGILNTTAGNLTLVSNATGTARLGKVSNGTLVGNITVQRFIAKNSNLADPNTTKGWFHVGTPIINQKVLNWVDNVYIQGPWMLPRKSANLLFHHEDYYNQENLLISNPAYYTKQGWYDISGTDREILPGKGVKMYFYNEFFMNRPATLDNTGIPVTGNFDFGITYSPLTGYDGGGWNFVANPYPSDIDWTNAAGWTKTGMLNTIYVWDARANQGKGQYQVCSIDQNGQITLINGATGQIASGQAFFVKSNTNNPVLTINEDAKTVLATSFLKTSTSSNGLKIQLLNKQNESDEIVIRLNEKAKNSFDAGFDAYKLYGGSVNIASLSKEGKELTVNTLPVLPDTISLNLAENIKGEYILNFSNLESFTAGTKLFLLDKLLGKTADIFTQQVYNFTITDEAKTAGKDRFALVLIPSQTKVAIGGTIRTAKGNTIKGVNVLLLSETNTDKSITSSEGKFNFSPDLYGNYTLKVENTEAKTEISVLDVVMARRYLNGKTTLSPYQLIAGDVDNTRTFTVEDITWMQEFVLNHTLHLPKNKAWEFIPSDFTFANLKNPFSYPTTKIVKNNKETQADFVGIATGKLGTLTDLQKETVDFVIDNVAYLPGQTIRVPIKVANFNLIAGYQFAIKWNKEMLAFVSVGNSVLKSRFGIAKVNEGVMTNVWDDASGESVSLPDGTTIFEMTFKVIGTAGNQGSFAEKSEILTGMAIDNNLQALSIKLSNASVKVVKEGEGFEVYPNYPNPFATETNISFNLPETAQVEVTVYSTVGQTIDTFAYKAKAGHNEMTWNPTQHNKNVENGIYIYTVRYKDQMIHNKMLVNK